MEGVIAFITFFFLGILMFLGWAEKHPIINNENINFNSNHKYFPKNRLELVYLLRDESILLHEINTSKITDMSFLFYNAKSEDAASKILSGMEMTDFNMRNNAGARKNFAGIETWDTSNVEDMTGMFAMQATFNQDISGWDTSRVKSMVCMFFCARSFNAPIGAWNVGNVVNMCAMFSWAMSFNQDISQWNAVSVRDMRNMFAHCYGFRKLKSVLQSGLMREYGSGIKRTGMFSCVLGAEEFFRGAIIEHFYASRQYRNLTEYDFLGLVEDCVQDLTAI